jgi:5-(carboxyamino)imidazole ribonucleotide synthase
MKKGFNNLKVGILGGGQLGRMLLQKSADFSLHMRVLDPDPAAPCRYLCDEFVNGSFKDFDTVYTFGRGCDLVTIEIEHVNVEALEKLEQEGVMIFPQPHVIRIVQDKGLQKMFFREHNIPTADFELIDNASGLSTMSMKLPVMQKLRKGGYDGKGVVRISGKEDFDVAFAEPSVAEKLIPFKKEIAVIVARNIMGETKSFPAVDMEFNPEANLVEFLFSPADISEKTEREAEEIAVKVAEELKIVGVLAVEMFLTNNDEILVNEIAPRPHNSGHHTIEANLVSQYEQHLRAILGLPLGETTALQHSVMVNLLGEKGHDGTALYQNIEETLSIPGVYVHLYGKKFTRPFRKMGHVTVTGKTKDDAVSKALQVKKLLKVISD